MIHRSLTFADPAAALAAFSAALGRPLDALPSDDWIDGAHIDIVELGVVRAPVEPDPESGAVDILAVGPVVPGWHVLAAWRGEDESFPPALAAAVVDRSAEPWWPRLG